VAPPKPVGTARVARFVMPALGAELPRDAVSAFALHGRCATRSCSAAACSRSALLNVAFAQEVSVAIPQTATISPSAM